MRHAKEAIALHVRSLKKRHQPIPEQERAFHTVVEIAA